MKHENNIFISKSLKIDSRFIVDNWSKHLTDAETYKIPNIDKESDLLSKLYNHSMKIMDEEYSKDMIFNFDNIFKGIYHYNILYFYSSLTNATAKKRELSLRDLDISKSYSNTLSDIETSIIGKLLGIERDTQTKKAINPPKGNDYFSYKNSYNRGYNIPFLCKEAIEILCKTSKHNPFIYSLPTKLNKDSPQALDMFKKHFFDPTIFNDKFSEALKNILYSPTLVEATQSRCNPFSRFTDKPIKSFFMKYNCELLSLQKNLGQDNSQEYIYTSYIFEYLFSYSFYTKCLDSISDIPTQFNDFFLEIIFEISTLSNPYIQYPIFKSVLIAYHFFIKHCELELDVIVHTKKYFSTILREFNEDYVDKFSYIVNRLFNVRFNPYTNEKNTLIEICKYINLNQTCFLEPLLHSYPNSPHEQDLLFNLSMRRDSFFIDKESE